MAMKTGFSLYADFAMKLPSLKPTGKSELHLKHSGGLADKYFQNNCGERPSWRWGGVAGIAEGFPVTALSAPILQPWEWAGPEEATEFPMRLVLTGITRFA